MIKIMTDKEKIIKYLEYKGISKNKFYTKTGFSVGFLDSGNSLGVDKLKKIIDNYHDLNLEWFFDDDSPMLKSTDPNNVGSNIVAEPAISIYKLRTDYYGVEKQNIPLYEVEASAGLNMLFSSQNTQIPLDYISVPNAPKCDGALFVRGDSMYPLLKAGDIVCYKTIQNIDNIVFGEMYLLDIDNGDDQFLTVKYVQKSEKGEKHIKLVSENKYHADKDEPISHIRALAIIKLTIRYNTIS